MKFQVTSERWGLLWIIPVLLLFFSGNCTEGESAHMHPVSIKTDTLPVTNELKPDTLEYLQRMQRLANGDRSGRWPVKDVFPVEGAVLPYNRVIAYYGNFYCKQMGILGEHDPLVVLKKLKEQAMEWEGADTLTPVVPAIHYIAVTAQGSPCDGNYRLRMPEKEILKAIAMADSIKGLVFLDIQVGLSSLQKELPLLEKYLKRPNVHLGVDPEFSMKSGKRPGTAIGSFDAADINYATAFLADISKRYETPPKILVVHRFTQNMLTNYKQIRLRPEVQVVIHMDGFGSPDLKRSSYLHFIFRQPVQFTGLKVFYKNDVKTGGRIMKPDEILRLQPSPIYIQYQ